MTDPPPLCQKKGGGLVGGGGGKFSQNFRTLTLTAVERLWFEDILTKGRLNK